MIPNEWKALSEELLRIPTINKSRVSPEKLFRAYEKGQTFTLKQEVGGKTLVYAFGALWKTKVDGWLEMGTMYVHPGYRGQGTISTMFHELLKIAQSEEKSIFLITRSETIANVALGAEWIEPNNWNTAPCAVAVTSKKNPGDGRRLFFRHQSTS